MTKEELQNLINLEVKRQLNIMVPKLVKPLVQESVAGALARLLAEGIVESNNYSDRPIVETKTKILRPNIKRRSETSHQTTSANVPESSVSLDPNIRRNIAEKYGMSKQDLLGSIRQKPKLIENQINVADYDREPVGGTILNNILNETAHSMYTENVAPSVLDDVDTMSEISPEAVGALVRDYSQLMSKLRRD